jgi:D-beta-D-heptose 7-phosphate kinase / D-beta-D-heptose 1-phosphate adenosyltransferase
MNPLVIIGDSLLDRDLTGHVDRICPDAPAPVFEQDGSRDRPGGAALAAALAARSARPVRLVTRLGDDDAGRRLRRLLADHDVEVIDAGPCPSTPEKIRVRSTGGVTVLRIDVGTAAKATGGIDRDALAALHDAAAVLVSDYGRGMTADVGLRRTVAAVNARRPVVWDPHPKGADPVPDLRLITPNESELPDDGAGREHNRLAELSRRAAGARAAWRASAVAVTIGADGALLAEGGGVPLIVPAGGHDDGGDTCGAGDIFAVSAAHALADGALTSEAVQHAVASASGFVRAGAAGSFGDAEPAKPGPAVAGLPNAIRLAEATRAAGKLVVATGGCFDLLHAGHVATLQAARRLGGCLIVCLNSDAGVRARKGPDRPVNPQQERAQLLRALACVDAVVVFDDPTPLPVLGLLRPDVWVKGGDYSADTLPEAEHVAAWGGQTVVAPYLSGHSTTGMLGAIRRPSARRMG